jgi:hypothetical protein
VLQIGVLRPLQVEVDGALADLGGPRQRAVLLRLLVGQGSSVSADRLLTDLCDGAPPPSALSGRTAGSDVAQAGSRRMPGNAVGHRALRAYGGGNITSRRRSTSGWGTTAAPSCFR